MMPTARSMTLPREMNSLNSFSMASLSGREPPSLKQD
jgi:hypothetical protein